MTRRHSNEFLGLPYRFTQGRLRWARTFARNLGMGSYLALVAGVVNSVAFLSMGTYVSHISGHATRSAVEYSEGHYTVAASFLLATAVFVGGAVLTTLCLGGQSLEDRTRRFAIPIALEMCVLGAVVLSQENVSASPSAFIYLFSFAMGLQNALIRRASGTIVRTTHMTGVATDMGIAIGTALLAFVAEVRLALREPWHPLLVSLVVRSFVRVFRFEMFLLHFTIFASFLVGAVVGTLGFLRFAFDILYCPLGILGIIIVRELRPRRRRR